MSDTKVISVVGATGAQGGGLVRVILNDRNGPFKVRALTRDVLPIKLERSLRSVPKPRRATLTISRA